jgi:hypothetical protein
MDSGDKKVQIFVYERHTFNGLENKEALFYGTKDFLTKRF